VNAIPGEGFNLDDWDRLRLGGGRCSRHGGVGLGSVGMMK
jgi:hypothetical protein